MNKELEDDNFLNYQVFITTIFRMFLVRIFGFMTAAGYALLFRGLESAGSRYHLKKAPTVLRIINCSREQDTS